MSKMSDYFFCAYDVEHMGVKCTGARWSYEYGNIFRFEKDEEKFIFKQCWDIDSNADTDHIKKVIEYQFLPWWADKKIEYLQKKYDDLSKEFDRTINYIKMMKNFNKQ